MAESTFLEMTRYRSGSVVRKCFPDTNLQHEVKGRMNTANVGRVVLVLLRYVVNGKMATLAWLVDCREPVRFKRRVQVLLESKDINQVYSKMNAKCL